MQAVIVADPKTVRPVHTPLGTVSASVKRRIGSFRLLDDGTLEGECRLEFTGHWAQTFREVEDNETDADREKTLRELVKGRLPGAEVSDVRFEHLADPAKPYSSVYRIRVPGYAQRTGARLFLQPALFQKGTDAIFAADARVADVYFPFPWSEEDEVTVELPPGFTLEQPNAPAPIDAGAGKYALTIGTADGWKHLTLKRQFSFGLKELILFKPTMYPRIKQFFDFVHASDVHTLVLRRAEAGK